MEERLKPTNKLRVWWSNAEKDIMIYHPKWKADGHYIAGIFNREFLEELESRGYDLKTIRFSIAYKKEK